MLFLNAAVFENDYKCSQDNIELMFQVNYLAHFYLSRLLFENLRNSEESRIIIIGCESHRFVSTKYFDL
jgi:NAD(P)-dependent dehydrogenase (short-subunit alcohol dehydrogenase family)